jgi:hypothetical protein
VIRRLLPAVVAVVLLLVPAAALAPASEVRNKLVGATKELARLIKDENQTQVAIKEFTGPALPRTSAGPMIQTILLEELKKHNIQVNPNAFLFVGGEYFVLEEEKVKSEDLTVRLLITLRNKKAKKLVELNIDIGYRGNDDLIKLLALNADLEKYPKADREGQNQQLRKQYDRPPLKLESTKIKVSPNSKYAVEVLTRPAGGGPLKVLTPRGDKGQAYVEIKKGEEYVLRLYNNSAYEAAVSITIDGVDAFQFYEPAAARPGSYLIGPRQARQVNGWMRNTNEVNAFLVGSFIDSAAYQVLRGSKQIGTITVCFHPCWKGPKPPPGYEGARNLNPNATGLGRKIGEKSQVIKRTIGPLAAAVSIRYNK